VPKNVTQVPAGKQFNGVCNKEQKLLPSEIWTWFLCQHL